MAVNLKARVGRTEQISRHYLALRRMLWRHFNAEEPWVLEWIRMPSDTCGRANSIWIRFVWRGKFLNPERNSCGFKNIRIRVDEALFLQFENGAFWIRLDGGTTIMISDSPNRLNCRIPCHSNWLLRSRLRGTQKLINSSWINFFVAGCAVRRNLLAVKILRHPVTRIQKCVYASFFKLATSATSSLNHIAHCVPRTA